MLITSVRDDQNNRWKGHAKKKTKTKKKQQNHKQNKERKEQRCDTIYRERVRANWFCCAFKLEFLQLICKASLIFKSKVQWALSINLNERGWYESW